MVDHKYKMQNLKVAKTEISRLVDYFSLSPVHRAPLLQKYKIINKKSNSGFSYKEPKILVPLNLYFYCKNREIVINLFELIENSQMTLDLFSDFIFQISDSDIMITEFSLRRQGNILSLIYNLNTKEVFSFDITNIYEVDRFLSSPYYKLVHKEADNYINQVYNFKINEFITVKFQKNKAMIFITGEPFLQCMRLLINIPIEEMEKYDEIESIDEVASQLDYKDDDTFTSYNISPLEEFRGHCSNLQTWVENNYDTRILHRNIAFPLLKRLAEVGDPIAKKVFKEEIAARFESGFPPTLLFLLTNHYLEYFTLDERQILFENIEFSYIESYESVDFFQIMRELFKLGFVRASCYD